MVSWWCDDSNGDDDGNGDGDGNGDDDGDGDDDDGDDDDGWSKMVMMLTMIFFLVFRRAFQEIRDRKERKRISTRENPRTWNGVKE